ncbi:MAG: enoyl-CoA hydratase [Saprospiraceae bacterium]|nr:enoyl-CoA hydratase [Saprospiraceae bacterium]
MHYELLDIEQQEGILTVTINRETALNALNAQTLQELQFFFEKDAPQRMDYKGIILTGAGEKAFVAGADIKEFLGLDGKQGEALARQGQAVFFSIERLPKPVIAVVNGYALGGGCELCMACHLRIATQNAAFGQPEVNLGIIPGYGGTQRLVQYIGKSKALELMMTGDMLLAEEAQRLGLVNYVLPTKAEALAKATALLHKIGTKAPLAIANVIQSVNAYFDAHTDGFEAEVKNFGVVTDTHDFQEGATAFVEKRKPQFKGK